VLDLHCHILPGVDDGASDLESALEMARVMVSAGYRSVAPSPHFGMGPGGDVGSDVAERTRDALRGNLRAAGIALDILPNAEHHVTPELFTRIDEKNVTPIGGGRWLLVELPWQALVRPEEVLFRLQLKGYRLLLAHPERYSYVDVDMIDRMVGRDIHMQLEIGSFCKHYGRAAYKKALAMMDRGLAHVLATDLHGPDKASHLIDAGLAEVRKRYGDNAVLRGTHDNPHRVLEDQIYLTALTA
jgi:protein-tyrosine phosphatase